MRYFELKIDVELKHRIYHKSSLEVISKFLASYFMSKGDTSHLENKFKYVFSNFNNPKDGYYEGKTNFIFRSFDKKYIDLLVSSIMWEDKFLRVEGIKFREVKFREYKNFITLNPVFVTLKNNRFWTYKESGDILLFIDRLTNNLIKKYNFISGENVTKADFIGYLKFKNKKPFKVRYKDKDFFGNKIIASIKDNEIAKKLSFVGFGYGLGEKNALIGGGFLKEIKSVDFGDEDD
ncbi:hypothetical protein FE773_07100 [Caminibacter mediatlanticus TB-2]|uniref:CRISPR associated protein Cas6 C-terminal domain-containing protein n=1 Tax=Caminibacter mediatlanticus TB-2 TaxID=391592 RepID=A0ABX5V9J6_9BACT|nr:CRISPR-associated endoribonuclease Cas6 [Caminibacter mediatlanticus]QCT94963.1 hypothetical protein FE773_07100 [Caminibacter mediatlanticus TB-2]